MKSNRLESLVSYCTRELGSDELIDLGQQALACQAWRWMPGMRTLDGYRVVAVYRWGAEAVREELKCDTIDILPGSDCLPDLNDPATLGCISALAREAQSSLQIELKANRLKVFEEAEVIHWGKITQAEDEILEVFRLLVVDTLGDAVTGEWGTGEFRTINKVNPTLQDLPSVLLPNTKYVFNLSCCWVDFSDSDECDRVRINVTQVGDTTVDIPLTGYQFLVAIGAIP